MRCLMLLTLAVLAGACATPPSGDDFDGDGVRDALDCGPAAADIFPGASDPAGDGVDQDCDGRDGVDADGDGFVANLAADDPLRDCDDADAAVSPAATEIDANGSDEDCDGSDVADLDGDGTRDSADCAPANAALDGADRDGDGASTCGGDCDDDDATRYVDDFDGDGLSPCDGDCDDVRPSVYPGAPERCDGLDDDCSGAAGVDEQDADLDGILICAGDCDDDDDTLRPTDVDGDGASSCDGDCDDDDATRSLADRDHDGVTTCGGDCDDADGGRHPGAAEACDGVDGDCDGGVGPEEVDGDGDGARACADCDDADAAVATPDLDGDGYDACTGDCGPGNPAMYPGAPDPWGDGLDQDCGGGDGHDADGDGWPGNAPSLSAQHDCDDTDPDIGRDDRDGDGVDACSGDCDDDDPNRYPGHAEALCDRFDSDCAPDPREVDDDGDGAAPCEGDCDDGDWFASVADRDGDGVSACGGDCDDDDGAVGPGSPWEATDGVDSNCDGDDGFVVATAAPALFGAHAFAASARATVALGDLDGDGRDDLLVGASRESETVGWAGALSVVSGADVGGVAGLAATRSGVAVGTEYAQLGADAVSLGDLDGDGLPEVAAAAASLDDGKVFVFHGATLATPGQHALSAAAAVLETPGLHLDDYELVGGAHLAVGDFDADGVPDLAVGGPRGSTSLGLGVLRLFSGAALRAALDDFTDDPGAGTRSVPALWELGANDSVSLGAAVAAVPDVDGDGAPELAVSDPGFDGGRGRAYVIWSAPLSGGVVNAAFIAGAWPDHAFGWSLAGLDGGSRGILAVAGKVAVADDAPGATASLFHGATLQQPGPTPADAFASLHIGADDTLHVSCVALSPLGDLDGDGYEEIGLGAVQVDPAPAPYPKDLFVFSMADVVSGVYGRADARTWYVDARSWGLDAPRAVPVGDIDADGVTEIALMNWETISGTVWLLEGAR